LVTSGKLLLLNVVMLFFAQTLVAQKDSSKADTLKQLTFDTGVFENGNVDRQKLLNGNCNRPGKIESINKRFLSHSTIEATDPKDRRWNIDRIYRDVFKDGTSIENSNFSLQCLYGLLQLSIQETVQTAHNRNQKNVCFETLEKLSKTKRDEKPKLCPEESWQEALKAADILRRLETSIEEQNQSISVTLDKVRTETEAASPACLNCVAGSLASMAKTASDLEGVADLKRGVCCQILVEKKRIADQSQCANAIDPQESKVADSVFSGDCAKSLYDGIANGISALNPIELLAAVPEMATIFKELLIGDKRGDTLSLIYSGILKGVTGYESDVWGCLNSNARIKYGCEIFAHSSTLVLGAAGIFKIIRILKESSLAISTASKVTQSVVASRPYALATDAIHFVAGHKLYAQFNVAEMVSKIKGMVSIQIGAGFETLSKTFPVAYTRIKSYFDAIETTTQAAKEILKIDAQLVHARKSVNSQVEIDGLMQQRAIAVQTFEESQKDLAVKLTNYVKTTLIFTIQKTSPSAAAPLAEHIEAQPLSSEENQ